MDRPGCRRRCCRARIHNGRTSHCAEHGSRSLCPECRLRSRQPASPTAPSKLGQGRLCVMHEPQQYDDTVDVGPLFFALYGQVRSYAQSKHRLASPASTGLRSFRKCNSEPKDETRFGALGVNQWHIKSMSLWACQRLIQHDAERNTYWQLLVISEKQLSSSFDQLPRT